MEDVDAGCFVQIWADVGDVEEEDWEQEGCEDDVDGVEHAVVPTPDRGQSCGADGCEG